MEKNQKSRNERERQTKAWPVILCLLFAVGVFVLLLNVEARQLAQYEKGSVVVAITDVAESKEITEENLTEYFAVEARALSDIPQAAYLDLEELVGQYAQRRWIFKIP